MARNRELFDAVARAPQRVRSRQAARHGFRDVFACRRVRDRVQLGADFERQRLLRWYGFRCGRFGGYVEWRRFGRRCSSGGNSSPGGSAGGFAGSGGTTGSGGNPGTAPDANDRDFIECYLDQAKAAEDTEGARLIDYLDLHWYPEARGADQRITDGDNSAAVVDARVQAPRSLWDDTYEETSWIRHYFGGPIDLLARRQAKIDAHYPGT